MAPFLLRAAPFLGTAFPQTGAAAFGNENSAGEFSEHRYTPHYPAQSPLAGLLRLVAPGSDEYVSEEYAAEIGLILGQWSRALKTSCRDLAFLAGFLDPGIEASRLSAPGETAVRSGNGIGAGIGAGIEAPIEIVRRRFGAGRVSGAAGFLGELQSWLAPVEKVETAEFEITRIEELAVTPLAVDLSLRYDLVAVLKDGRREERVGAWNCRWSRDGAEGWKLRSLEAGEETAGRLRGPGFVDVSSRAFAGAPSYPAQMLRGADYWRTVLDGACGIDVYGNNGVALGDFDNDGFDDLYVCQPAGLPNRLYRNRGDGTLEDVTEKAGVGVLDNTACALFADFENKGLQDLLVVSSSGPLLFLNRGDGAFALKRDAFRFARPPQGSFTHAAVADYDRDGRLDVYFCMYSYYLGLDQYHYPVPYFDARNGPGNCLMHNEGNAIFSDATEAAGMNAGNDRYSFACAWGDAAGTGFPDLYVANDFGRGNLYRNRGDGTFVSAAAKAHADDTGAGMSASWVDCLNRGKQDIYAANMWSAAGQRVSQQARFHANAPQAIRAHYRQHASGNALYRNRGDGAFENEAEAAGVAMGRWSWCSDFWDFDHDGFPDLYVANGYISAPEGKDGPDRNGDKADLGSFFWRQVVAKSPEDATPSLAYEHGWNALNELIRSDASWSGRERNVLFANGRDGAFAEVSGALGLDFREDSRAFALADLDHDGRLEVVLKNRNAPQLRLLHNAMQGLGTSIAFRLRGKASNRDAIGAAITVEAGALRQTKYLQAGSGFLAQHSKEVFFGLGEFKDAVRATIRWPRGLTQTFERLPLNHRIAIEEGSAAFDAKPFRPTSPAYAAPGDAPTREPMPEQLPAQAETWLIEPLKAPEFSLPDLAGNAVALSSFRGASLLLHFWAAGAPRGREQLRLLAQRERALQAGPLAVLAVNLDGEEGRAAAKSFVAGQRFAFPVVFATEEVGGIYNIVYRYLFDRRRDMAIPTSMLLDKDGTIVKLYQGVFDVPGIVASARSLPLDPRDRILRALPFPGTLWNGEFQRNDFTYGVAMFQHGYLEQAAESFEQVVRDKPEDPEAYYNLGTLSLRRNNFDQARQYLEKTLALRPNYPEAWNNLGMMAAQQGNLDEAIRSFQQSLEQRPTYTIALLNLGNVYRRQKLFDKAQQCLTRALELEPDDPEVNYGLGMLYAQQNQAQLAAQYLGRAIDLRPDYPEALNNLGVLLVRSQDYAKAEEQFKTCIRLVPQFDQSYLNLARLYAMRGDKEKARGALKELLRLQPGNANAARAMEALQ